MSTLRSIVSSIRGMNKLFSADNKITSRLIASEVRSTMLMLLKQQTDKRKYWQSPNLFTAVECLEMEEVPLSECCDYKSPCNIRKSVKELPKVAEGIFGLLIQGVYSTDNTLVYDFMTPNRYANLLRMGNKGKNRFYWIRDKHLYITTVDVEKVNIYALFEEDVPNDLNACSPSVNCNNPLDVELNLPGPLEFNLKSIVYDTLAKTYFRHIQDFTTDNHDDTK